MKNAASLALLIAMTATLAVRSARAQAADDKQVNADLDSGKRCPTYTVDVPTLVDTDHRIYWKQADCIIIRITNNPFRYTYKASVNEEKITEDDVIGSLGSLIGLKSITSTNTAQKTSTAPAPVPAPAGPAPEPAGGVVDLRGKRLASKPARKTCTAAEGTVALQATKSQLDGVQAKLDLIEPTVRLVTSAAQQTGDKLKQKDEEYETYLSTFLNSFRALVEAPSATDAEQKALQNAGYALQQNAFNLSKDLTGDTPFETSLVNGFATAQAANTQLNSLKIPTPSASGCTLSDAQRQEQQEAIKPITDKIDEYTFAVKSAAVDIANQTCHYKARKGGEYSWVYDKVYEWVSTILIDQDLFDSSVKREGPFVDPTSAVLTITRDIRSNDATTSIAVSDDSVLSCSADPDSVFKSIKPAKTLDSIPAPTATSTDDAKNGSKGASKNTTNTADSKKSKGSSTTNKTQDPTTVVLQQPWIFGRPRLVLSGGLTVGFLDDKQYQRSTNSSGSAVVGLKTDQRERLTPMLYGHVLLPRYARHDSDAFYGTLGVTAKSDNQGTDPEFLVGISRSIAQQRFFLTLGAYVGEKQKLDGGWQLGQTIPPSFGGELPVTKGYHVGWGFGISYRFTSTKDPQKDTSSQATQTSKNSKSKGK